MYQGSNKIRSLEHNQEKGKLQKDRPTDQNIKRSTH